MSELKLLNALKIKPVRNIWFSQVFSCFGDELYTFALLLTLTQLIGPSAGYILGVQASVILLSTFTSAAFTERFTHKTIMIASDLARAAAALSPFIYWVIFGSHSVGVIIISIVILSYFRPIFDPSLQASIPIIAGDRSLLQAVNGLFDVMRRLSRMIGPVVGAMFVTLFSPYLLFLLNAATFLASCVGIIATRRILNVPAASTAHSNPSSLKRNYNSLKRGFMALNQNFPVHFQLLSYALCGGFWYIALILATAIKIKETYPSDPGAFGYVIGVYGMFNVLSNIICSELTFSRPIIMMSIGRLITGIGFLAMAFSSNIYAICFWAAFSAIGAPITQLPLATQLQTSFHSEDVPRIFRVRIFYEWSFILVAYLVAPFALTTFGDRAVILFSAFLYILFALIGMTWVKDAQRSVLAP